jgi:hypothetical protein
VFVEFAVEGGDGVVALTQAAFKNAISLSFAVSCTRSASMMLLDGRSPGSGQVPGQEVFVSVDGSAGHSGALGHGVNIDRGVLFAQFSQGLVDAAASSR